MSKIVEPRSVEEVLQGPGSGRGIPADVQPLVDAAVQEAVHDPSPLGPKISVSVGEHWPGRFDGYSKVLVYDQFSIHPQNLHEVHVRSEQGTQVVISVNGGSSIGYDPEIQAEPLPNRVRKAISAALGAGEDGYVELRGLGPRNTFELELRLTGPYLGKPIECGNSG